MPKGIYDRLPRKPKAYAAEIVSAVRELYALGMTQAEIAVAIGITQKVVWRLMRHHAIAARKAVIRQHIRGDKHPNWKGDAATYKAFHLRLYKAYGAPMRCERCGTTDRRRKYDWANLTGNYADMSDYQRMCRHCHRQFDADRGAYDLPTRS